MSSYSDINWTQRSRYNDQARSSHSRISLLSTPTEEPSFVRNATTAHSTTHSSHLNKTLSKLIDRFDISPRNASLGDIQRQKDRLVDKFSRILSTHIEPSIVENENDMANTIHTQLQESQDPEKAHRFGHLYNKLASRQILEKKWSILYLLSLTSELPSRSTSDLSTLDSPRATLSGLPNLHHETAAAADYLQPPASRPYDTHSSDSPRNIRRRLARESASPQRESMELDAAPPAVQLARAREAHSRMTEAVYVSEADLLRDLIFLFQGIDGQYIQYDTQLNDHVFIPGIQVSPSMTNMVFKLADIGWLYTKVRNFVSDNMDSPTIGLVGQSLCAALQQELTEYYKLIAILEAQVEKQMIHNQVTSQSLTLKKLLMWTLDCNQKLRLMSVLVDVCQGQKGGALIASIHNYTKHGDPFIKDYLTKMLQIVSKPFYEMLERWVYEGELDDPYEEFFVACDRTVTEEELWQSKYTMREDMLPAFLSKELAHKIFSIGKSLNFIRYSCHEDTLAEQQQQQDASTAAALGKQPFKYGETEQVEKSIEVAYTATSRALLNLLKTKYKLMDHLKALKRYLLLGQGDFIQYLMDILWVNLSKPANTLFRHNLTGVLEAAIRSCNAQYDDPQILTRLDVRLMEIQKDDLGWDVFSLDYHVDAPINTVFSPTAMHQYLEAFNFLWRLKRVEYTLAAAWRQWVKASREFTHLPELQQDIQFAQLTIQRMIHFIYQLQHYVLFEVLECSWDTLETFIEHKSVDLDSIIAAHNNYLREITEKGFLTGPKQEALAGKLGSIFDCILQYNIVLEYLYKYATQESLKRSSRGLSDVEKMSKIRKRHEDMEDQFTMQVLGFLDVLKSYHDEDLRSLSTRLDYNDFYTKFNETSQNVDLL